MDLAELTIFDLSDLTDDEAWIGVRAKLQAFPQLREVYDDAFLTRLIASRKTSTSTLLFYLVCTDDAAQHFWQTVLSQMHAVGYTRALAAFAEKMRRDEPGNVESWTSELRCAAWLVEQGITIDLEPTVGKRKAEFGADTTPRTTWEIKTPADDERQRGEQRVLFDLQRLLRRLPTPVVLSLTMDTGTVTRDVQDIAREVKARLAGLDMERTTFPFEMNFGALEVSVSPANGDVGFIGSVMTSLQKLDGSHVARVAKIIRDAARQLPADGAGVVVIDGSHANWISKTSVADACFGSDMLAFTPTGGAFPDRGANGVFNPKQNRRVSAVVFTSPRFVHEGQSDIVVFYNPYARTPLTDAWLPNTAVLHGRLYAAGPARAVRVSGPDGISFL